MDIRDQNSGKHNACCNCIRQHDLHVAPNKGMRPYACGQGEMPRSLLTAKAVENMNNVNEKRTMRLTQYTAQH